MSRQFGRIKRSGVSQSDIDHIVFASGAALREIKNIGSRADEIFRQEKTRREFPVVARRPHHDRNAVAFDPDLQRFFDRDLVRLFA